MAHHRSLSLQHRQITASLVEPTVPTVVLICQPWVGNHRLNRLSHRLEQPTTATSTLSHSTSHRIACTTRTTTSGDQTARSQITTTPISSAWATRCGLPQSSKLSNSRRKTQNAVKLHAVFPSKKSTEQKASLVSNCGTYAVTHYVYHYNIQLSSSLSWCFSAGLIPLCFLTKSFSR